VKKLREILVCLGVCDGNMNEGSLRVDANVSVRPRGREAFGTRAEIKNVNSFRFLEQAILYEMDRQIELIESGGTVVQETRLFDAERGITISMRSKEEAHDYRYFPDPDRPPIVIDREWVERVRATLPELPDAKRARFQRDLGLSAYDTDLLCQSRETSDFFEATLALHADAKSIANWMTGTLFARMNAEGIESVAAAPLTPPLLAGMLDLIAKGTISLKIAKDVFDHMWTSGKDAETVVKEKGLVQISDTSAIEAEVDAVLAENPAEVEKYRAGGTKVLGFLVGAIMKRSRGKANPAIVNEILLRKLGG
jgi:aspartyl-tRNA(Asn)/glutamyl-tRNA(Gln) amidotransferase subunit B